MRVSPERGRDFSAASDFLFAIIWGLAMIHHTCDRCKRVIDPEHELRYVVRMEIEVVMDPIHDDEPQDDRDHLHEIDEILERVDVSAGDELGEDLYQKRRYDLCPQCYRKFSASPLGREKKAVALGFSQN